MKKLRILVGFALVLSLTATTASSTTGHAIEDPGQPTTHEAGTLPQGLSAPTPDAAPGKEDLILLRAETIDTSKRPSLDKAEIQSGLRLMGLSSSDSAYYLVQFRGPIREEWKAAVRNAGGKLYGFVPSHAVIVKMNGTTAEDVAALPEVKWVGLYRHSYKTAPPLTAEAQATSEPLVVTIMTFEPSAVEEVASAIEELGGQALDWKSGPRWGLIRAEIDPATVSDIARLVEVSWIERFVAPQTTNDVARGAGLMNVDVVHQAHGLTGAGQIIGHADTGLDVGDIAAIHPDFRGRIKAAFAWGRRDIAGFDSPGPGPMGLAWDGTHLWNIDWSSDQLYKLTSSGQVVTSCEPSVAVSAAGLVWDGGGFWYVERDDDTIYQLDTACNALDSFAAPDTHPYGLAWDGTDFWISDTGTDTIYQVDTSGTVLQSFPSPGPYPSSLLWMDGYLWCGDSTDDIIFKLDASGTVLEWLPAPGPYASGLAWDGANIWVSDPGLDQISKLDLDPTPQGDWSDPDGHGTHTAGSILGDGSVSGGEYKGTAPDAELVHQSIMDSAGRLGGLPVDLGDLFSQAYDEGARIHSDSWGADVAGEYNANSAAADAFMWDHEDMLLVFSAGNAGVDANSDGIVDADSMGAPGTAKNLLTVGASENYRPTIDRTWSSFGFRANPIRDDTRADNVSGLAAFSSRGPTDDGRIKPDLVGPGTHIISTRSQEWPFYDDMEGTSLPRAQAGATGLDSPAAAPVSCMPISLDPKDVLFTDGTDLTLPLIACSEFWTQETENQTRPDERLESSSANWTPTGGWTTTTEDYRSPTHSWVDHYATNARDRLTSKRMDVRTGGNIIGFWTRYDFESGDKGALYFSDDGTHWIGYSIEGTQSEWTYKTYYIPWGYCWLVPLPWPPGSYTITCLSDKSAFRFRFLADADSDALNGYWYLDDTRIFDSGWGLLSDEGVAPVGSTEDENYIFMGGTSMSAPLVAGSAGLVRQFYTDREAIQPSAALVKATLINGATDMTPGQYGVGSTGSPILSDDMESGAGNWTPEAPWALTTSKYHSTDHSWTDSPGDDYSNNADVSLTSVGSFDLTAVPNPGLVFWHQYEIEYGFDYGFVEISTNGGISWTQELAVTGTMTDWVRSVVDLSPYSAETAVKIRFRLDTDSSRTEDGWYIDDVSIEPVSFQEVATRPNTVQGWGRVNLGHSLFPTEPRAMVYFDMSDGLSTGESDSIEVDVADSSEPLRITLVWTDYPSTVAAAINLVNNLDLRLIGPDSTVYYPNGLATADVLNNVEGIDVASPPPGTYTVEVNGTEVVEGPQPYALVISGAFSADRYVYLPLMLQNAP